MMNCIFRGFVSRGIRWRQVTEAMAEMAAVVAMAAIAAMAVMAAVVLCWMLQHATFCRCSTAITWVSARVWKGDAAQM